MNKQTIQAAGLALAAACLCTVDAQANQGDDEHHDIEEIIVRAKPIERTVEQLAQPVTIVTGDALIQKQAASLGETLASEPGVSSSYFGPVASRPVIRGQFGERIRILANGLDALDASALSEDHAVSLDSILADRVEIVKGPATLLYGSGAAGGIVNVVDSRIRETPIAPGLSGAASLGTDSATGKEAIAARIDAALDNGIVLHADGFRRTTDDFEIPGFAESARLRALEEAEGEEEEEEGEEEAFGTVENTDSEVYGGAVGASIVGDNSFVGFSVSRYDSQYGVPGTHGHGHGHGEEVGMEEEEEEEEIIRIDLAQTRYDLKAGLDFDGFINGLRFDIVRNDYRHVELEGEETGTVFDTLGTDARLEITHAPTGGFEGAFGLQYKEIDFAAIGEEAFVPPSDTTQTSLFAFEEYRLSDTWTLQGSARIERQEILTPVAPDYDETAFGASLGAIWAFADTMSVAANVSMTERHPNSTELYASGPHLAVQRFECGTYFPVGPDGECAAEPVAGGQLDKEQSMNVDLTLRGNTERVEWTVTGFVNNVDDYVLLSPTGAENEEEELPVFAFSQADVELYGFEAEALVDLIDTDSGHLHTRLYADYVFGEEADTGAYLPQLPPLRYGIGLHYERGGLSAAVDATYHSEQEKSAANELPTDSFTMLNAELSYRLTGQDILVYMRGTNLGDEDARRHTSPLKDTVPLPGRSLQLGLRVDF